MKRFILFLLLASALFSSCRYITGKKIRGNGNVITQPRNVTDFTGVEVSSAMHLYVKQDSVFSIKVETDENLQPYIIIAKEGDLLVIRQENNTNLDPTGRIKVYVSAPSFSYLDASGACKIYGEGQLADTTSIGVEVSGASDAELDLKAPKITGKMTGASNLRLTGQTKDLLIEGSGASHASCFNLLAENTKVDISGASGAEVFASVELHAEASGASKIRYRGNARIAHSAESGAGSIKKVD